MRTIALINRICRQMVRDKRTLALLLIAPIFVLTLMHFLFDNTNTVLKLGVEGLDKEIIDALQEDLWTVEINLENESPYPENLDGILRNDAGKLTLIMNNVDPNSSKAIQMKVQKAVASVQSVRSLPINTAIQSYISMEYRYGSENTSFFDVFSTVLIGFFVFFFVFLISGIGLLRERMTGTLERLVSTPIKRREIIAGYLCGYGIFAVIQTVLVVLYAIWVLDSVMVGSVWLVILSNLLLASTALSLGILLSTFVTSEFQMMQFIPLIIIPQVFFAGIIPVDSMPKWLQVIANFMPLYYGADALKGVMYLGKGFADIAYDLLILAVFTIVFVVLNLFALKKYRAL